MDPRICIRITDLTFNQENTNFFFLNKNIMFQKLVVFWFISLIFMCVKQTFNFSFTLYKVTCPVYKYTVANNGQVSFYMYQNNTAMFKWSHCVRIFFIFRELYFTHYITISYKNTSMFNWSPCRRVSWRRPGPGSFWAGTTRLPPPCIKR